MTRKDKEKIINALNTHRLKHEELGDDGIADGLNIAIAIITDIEIEERRIKLGLSDAETPKYPQKSKQGNRPNPYGSSNY